MANDDATLLVDREYLRTVQYRTEVNLAARQSIYQFRRPPIDLIAAVLDLAGLTGNELVADIGCGNGRYLAELANRGHRGQVLGIDLSAGMLAAARQRSDAALVVGDAASLPLSCGVADVTLAMHMLYHVPDREAAVGELRRITRDGGRVLVVLNAEDHLLELRDLVAAAAADVGLPADVAWAEVRADGLAFSLAAGAEVLATEFGSVDAHDFSAELVVPEPGPLLDYVRSMRLSRSMSDPEAIVAAVARRIHASAYGPTRIRVRTGCLVSR